MNVLLNMSNIWLLGTLLGSSVSMAQLNQINTHPEYHPSQGYELVAIVDKAERYRGARNRKEVLEGKGKLVSQTGQTLSLFTLGEPDAWGSRAWQLVSIWDVSTGKEIEYQVKARFKNEQTGDIESKVVKAQAATATGFFPVLRLDKNYVSWTYGEAMPHSVGYFPEFGTYIHETRKDWCENYISTRRSAGCTRLCSEEARFFYNLVESKGMGWVLAYDKFTGFPLKDAKSGNWKYIKAYRTLVINTDSTPESLKTPLLPVLQGKPTINMDPKRYIENPNLIKEFFP